MNDEQGQKIKSTLEWIVGILKKYNIPFQISGGLAAKIYGSPRELNDIDIDIPSESFSQILDEVREYIIYGPDRFQDGKWDIDLTTLDYHGQLVDLSGTKNARYSNKARTKWLDLPTDFSKAEAREFMGMTLSVINREDLARYKSDLDGEHQLVDIQAIQNNVQNK